MSQGISIEDRAYVGGDGFGAKFEELLLVDESGVRWLSKNPPWLED